MKDVVENNILSFWLKMQDTERGGFYGQMRGDGTLVKEASKGGILNILRLQLTPRTIYYRTSSTRNMAESSGNWMLRAILSTQRSSSMQ